MPPYRVVLLPGIVLPADLAYGSLVEALGDDADAVVKDLEIYATDEPPAGYGLDAEIAGVLREADRRGWERFHLVGYSGGGAAALGAAVQCPERLASLALLEPAWAGTWDLSPREQAVARATEELESLPPDELLRTFVRVQLRPGVEPPPPPAGDPPPWMAKRPAGIRALLRAFESGDLDRERLRAFARPVYFALGGLSNPDYWEEMARRLATVFPDFEVEVFEDRHHFDPPHRIEPERLADSLRALWQRAEP
jgi:pimeloyl-ACP methyl ester carboxylesterase